MATILFDMDGLLLDTERVALLAYRKACKDVGLPSPDALFLQMVGKPGDVSRALLAQAYGIRSILKPLVNPGMQSLTGV